jgi:multidrug resistance efflux pump
MRYAAIIVLALGFASGCTRSAPVHVSTSQERQESRVSRAEHQVKWAQDDLARAEARLAKAEADLTLANAGLDADDEQK